MAFSNVLSGMVTTLFILSCSIMSAVWLQLFKTASAASVTAVSSRLFQACETNTECKLSGETCQTPLIGEGECVIPGTCVCLTSDFNFVFCTSDDNCNGTICAKEATNNSYGVCLSCVDFVNLPDESRNALDDGGKCDNVSVDRVSPTPQMSEDGTNDTDAMNVCVDAELLKHLPKQRLVFDTHFRAAVLCDRFGSCATPGHMVVYKGKPMMMRSYCQQVSCQRRVKHVNSPSMARALRIRTPSPDLSITAFAASYQSTLEERVVSFLVRIGLWALRN